MSSPLFRNLNCAVRVSASRNVWIRDRELNVEISGDVDLVKDNGGIRVYGSLDSRQGRYEFQNTGFAIDRGEINFRGSSDINPDLYIIATRRIRLVSNENAVISVVVGGTLMEPNISLESDTTPPLDESDILSYLLIGRPADDVSGLMGGEGGVGSRLEGQAAVLVLGVAANQLKRSIGRRLNLDVVEIDLGMGNSATRVRAGKYFDPGSLSAMHRTFPRQGGGKSWWSTNCCRKSRWRRSSERATNVSGIANHSGFSGKRSGDFHSETG